MRLRIKLTIRNETGLAVKQVHVTKVTQILIAHSEFRMNEIARFS